MMTEETLKSMEASAPMLVAEVRRLQVELKEMTHKCERTYRDWARVSNDYGELTEAIAVIVHAVAKEE